ncbi:hypothetical protein YC2023_052230 [Brassica napus]
MVISARVSNYKNFLKLLGCCLEFWLPVLAFDGAENRHGDASNGNNKMVLSWNQKLKIGKEVANALIYFTRLCLVYQVTHLFINMTTKEKT